MLSLLVIVLGYFFWSGRQMREGMDQQLMHQNPAERIAAPTSH